MSPGQVFSMSALIVSAFQLARKNVEALRRQPRLQPVD